MTHIDRNGPIAPAEADTRIKSGVTKGAQPGRRMRRIQTGTRCANPAGPAAGRFGPYITPRSRRPARASASRPRSRS